MKIPVDTVFLVFNHPFLTFSVVIRILLQSLKLFRFDLKFNRATDIGKHSLTELIKLYFLSPKLGVKRLMK